MTIAKVYSDVRDAWIDWQDYLINPNFVRRGIDVSWNGPSTRMPARVQAADVCAAVERREFSFQVRKDEAIVQMFYRFDESNEQLLRAMLAYYILPELRGLGASVDSSNALRGEEDALLDSEFDRGDSVLEGESGDARDFNFAGGDRDTLNVEFTDGTVPVWLRIDYDPVAEPRGVTHHDCHVHISGFPGARIPFAGVPGPRQFLEFVFASFYPDEYKEHRLTPELAPRNLELMEMVNVPAIVTLSTPASMLFISEFLVAHRRNERP